MRVDASRIRRCLLPAALCSLVAGCALQFNTRSLGVPVTMAAPAGQAAAGDTFNITTHAVYLFWGLASTKQPNLRESIAGQLGAGGGVNNLAIHSRMRWPDVLLTALTLGVVSSTSVTLSGVVTRGAP
ncbi:MAG: hypothetical protein ACHQX4_09735 [Gemmatimonadales bacterium]